MTFLYERVLKPIFFRFDPELMHDLAVGAGELLGKIPPARWLLNACYRYEHPSLRQEIAGIVFVNPVGLAAGFDKDCRLMGVLPSVGFGFEEVGSITAEPYEGNPKPRAIRLPADNSLIVYYGLKNLGAARLREKLIGKRFKFPIGVSIAKTNKLFKSEKEKVNDWLRGIDMLKDAGDYLTINLSCPNTFDTSNFCEPKMLLKLLKRIDKERFVFGKPVFLKIGADVSQKQLESILKLARPRPWITGFVVSNLVKDRRKLALRSHRKQWEPFKGGFSGKVVLPHALALVRHIRAASGERFVIIGCGGIFAAEDAYAYIRAGANLVQLITGMIYRGPGTIKEINRGLVRLLEKDGYANIVDAVGTE